MEETVLPGNGERMSDYLENLAARAMGKSDFLQPRMPSLFEPVLSKGPVSTSFCHTENLPGFELGAHDWKDSIQSDSIKSKAVRSDAIQSKVIQSDEVQSKVIQSDAVKSDSIQSDAIKSKVIQSDAAKSDSIQSDAIESNDLPLKPEEKAAATPREEMHRFPQERTIKLEAAELSQKEGDEKKPKSAIEHPVLSSLSSESIMESLIAGVNHGKMPLESNAFGAKIGKSPAKSIVSAFRRPNYMTVNQKSDIILKDELIPHAFGQVKEKGINPDIRPQAHRDVVFSKSSPGKERAEILATEKMELDFGEIAAQMVQSAPPGERSIAGPALLRDASISRPAAWSESSKNLIKSTQASQGLSELMPPSIKVTIGRIEVRAVTLPEKRETRTETKTPSTSLGDYLASLRGKAR